MAGLLGKVARFAGSPQGRAAIGKAKTAANDPENRAKIDGLVGKVKDRGRGPGQQGPGQQGPASRGPASRDRRPRSCRQPPAEGPSPAVRHV